MAVAVDKIHILSPIFALLNTDSFASLNFQGSFDRQGRKANVIQAKTADGLTVWYAFDDETKMLVSNTGDRYGITFSDYRKVGDVMLPFGIERDYLMKVKLDEILLNPAIDAARFIKKQNCFNIAN
jgi:hypothetical protein